jgi:hypothetical protein
MKGTINKLKQKVNAVPRSVQQGSRPNINGGWIYLDQTTHKQAVQKAKSDRDGRCVCLICTPKAPASWSKLALRRIVLGVSACNLKKSNSRQTKLDEVYCKQLFWMHAKSLLGTPEMFTSSTATDVSVLCLNQRNYLPFPERPIN